MKKITKEEMFLVNLVNKLDEITTVDMSINNAIYEIEKDIDLVNILTYMSDSKDLTFNKEMSNMKYIYDIQSRGLRYNNISFDRSYNIKDMFYLTNTCSFKKFKYMDNVSISLKDNFIDSVKFRFCYPNFYKKSNDKFIIKPIDFITVIPSSGIVFINLDVFNIIKSIT